jgi:hypothetical protein
LQGPQGLAGPKGDTGSQGPQGIQGLPGFVSGFNISLVSYTYEKRSNSALWNIPHNLGFMPNVTVIDYGQNNVECDIEHVDQNNLTLTFSEQISGHAYLS